MKNEMKKRISDEVTGVLPLLKSIRDDLYHHPEIGGEEEYASQRLIEVLKDNGFSVTETYGRIPYAFRASVTSKTSEVAGPTVALFAEYDALPDMGHGCGHNLICTAALGAALALKDVIEELGGTVVLYGTPGEENLCTKTTLSEQGFFDEADAALMVHPSPVTCASGRTRAIEALQIEYFGRSSHAGTAPEQGINALDAAVLCYQMIRTEKAKYGDVNVHGYINAAGEKASIIPAYTSLKYLTRAWDMETLAELREMVEQCAEKAAQETGCTYRVFNNEATNRSMVTNHALSAVFNQYLLEAGEPEILDRDVKGSTDMADVSWRIPAIHPWVGLNCLGTELHSPKFAEKTLSPEADVFLERCSNAMAWTAAEILTDGELLAKIKAEFEEKMHGAKK